MEFVEEIDNKNVFIIAVKGLYLLVEGDEDHERLFFFRPRAGLRGLCTSW